MNRLIFATIIASVLTFPATLSIAEECLRIGSPPKGTGAVALIAPGVSQTFKMAGYCMKHVEMPSKRLSKDMMEGKLDGEFVRVPSYIEAMKEHVVTVPTPIANTPGFLVTLATSGFKPNSIADVGSKKIGTILGFAWHENIAKKLKNVSQSKKYSLLAKQLSAGRIDGFLVDGATLGKLISSGLLPKANVHRSTAVAEISGYLLLHKKHIKIIDKVDNSLKQVKKEGGFDIQ